MNPLPLLLGFMLIKGLGKKDKDSGDGGLGSLLGNPDAMAMLPHVTKLFDSAATEQEKNDAVMALMTNPAVFDIVSRFTVKNDGGKSGKNNNDDAPADETAKNAGETGKREYSDESKEFFRPVEKVAGAEISGKLYKLYDNWYVKK